ncbi:bifunctional UDP-N-acetylglucosamine diphosphorylase/glucosamine-1-phosphate N-acetyltransferase GlmU [bacterium]|nr:bifunctional UDP-N-acetylglucosamine diphosphorylase/glucosamine-1-phosphate N-acetyltransferase GlmU [bacterium]
MPESTHDVSQLTALILAAGKGTRMKSALPKVLHRIAGEPLIGHVLATVERLGISRTVAIVGHGAEQVRAALSEAVQTVEQREQLGTAHAVLQAESALAGFTGEVVILSGDVPLLSPETLLAMLDTHRKAGAALTALTFKPQDPSRYGRIVRDAAGHLSRIVEYKDATEAEREIGEVNAGVYLADWPQLLAALKGIGNDNAQGEYYLPDAVTALNAKGLVVAAYATDDEIEVAGVNTRLELVALGEAYQERAARQWLEAGVTIESPRTTWIGPRVSLGEDTVVESGVQLYGRTRVGSGCRIGAHSQLIDAVLGDDVTILQSYLSESAVGDGTIVGPFAHLRNGAEIGTNCRIGNFVEVKGSVFGDGAKASHLAYIGDASVGAKANIGAGTITCNYDGERKHRTTIGEGSFVGSNNTLVAPVTIGAGAYTAAGSTITQDVPDGALAFGRARQAVKLGWAMQRKGIKQ